MSNIIHEKINACICRSCEQVLGRWTEEKPWFEAASNARNKKRNITMATGYASPGIEPGMLFGLLLTNKEEDSVKEDFGVNQRK